MLQAMGQQKSDKMQLSSAKAIVECLKREHVTTIFCVPGESYLPVMDAILDEESMKLISARHEGGAAFMAEGYAKAAKIPSVVMATRGVGGANLAIGVHTAYQDSTPMVVLLGQVHRKFRGREGFQEVELEQFFAPIAKWTVEINAVERIPELLQRAFRIAKTGRPGPVVVSLPEDLLKEEAEMQFGPVSVRPAPAPSQREISELTARLQQASTPIILAGGGVMSAGAEEALLLFAEKNMLPVVAAFRRHDVFPNDHPLYAGHLGLGTDSGILQTVQKADVIFAIGTRLSEVTTQDYTLFSPTQQLLHVDIDEAVLGKVYSPQLGIVADAKEALLALLKTDIQPAWKDWSQERRHIYQQATARPEKQSTKPLTNTDVIFTLQANLPDDAIITNDAGNFAGWLHTFYQFKQKNTYIGPTSGAMGYGLPAAIGAKLACPDRVVVSLSGDGGLMMTVQELETAVRCNIPIISIVFNNCMYGTIRMHQEIHFPKKVIGTDLGSIHFVKLAESLGAKGIFVKTEKELGEALQQAIKDKKPTLIEIEMDREQIAVAQTIQQIRNRNTK
ncbi:thiamine pyrophosphate-dependent enzyme [Bacillus chungangensis]|uniref:Acetolactate synthase-1/2/3 large subunit n=1 Tax=Bacillus chungangensis TaxID=587633 RepID=A0ABT9WR32_9BACI|nr:thiamine pyrophosphate-dependent enzyme [Bacillus chungangensis]MDQ0175761.1 acetolactate synthase-1/2/3 large subunit [Bacillus chungangensis]